MSPPVLSMLPVPVAGWRADLMPAKQETEVTLTANTVATVTFASRYSYAEIANEGPGEISVTGTGTAPTIDGADCAVVEAGQTIAVLNGAPQWWQGYGGPMNPLVAWKPGIPINYSGTKAANPGTVIKLISSGTPTAVVRGTG